MIFPNHPWFPWGKMHHFLQPVRSGIKDDTQEEIQVETSAEEKAVENFEEVVP